jgi:hypothetical protein
LDYVFEEASNIYIGIDMVIHGALNLKNGRKFGREGSHTLLLSFITFDKNPVEELISSQLLDSALVVNLEDISEREINKDENLTIAVYDNPLEKEYWNEDQKCILRKGLSFKFEPNLQKYLEDIKFRFDDGSSFRRYIGKYERESLVKKIH